MAEREIHELDFQLWLDTERRSEFVTQMGAALRDIGFFALFNHGIPLELIKSSYAISKRFFALDNAAKMRYEKTEIQRQRGFIPYGVEHAKGNPSPDLKEFWQTGRTLLPGHPKEGGFIANVWPDTDLPKFKVIVDDLYSQMESLSQELLAAASLDLGKPKNWLPEMAANGNTILRILHYPPISPTAPVGAVRSAEHEDINFITLLVGSTADGLEVMDHDGTWIKVAGSHEHIIVDSGDMIQNLSNGLYKSTTHRVVNPEDCTSDRYSMPMFVHPHNDVDLSPLPEYIEQTGGIAMYQNITAGDYLQQRLEEIGLTSE